MYQASKCYKASHKRKSTFVSVYEKKVQILDSLQDIASVIEAPSMERLRVNLSLCDLSGRGLR